ncbi:MAG: serine/threonine-protein kinase [Chloroflexota bacterium]
MKIPQKIGRYIIEREIGRGGMSIVYLAQDPLTERHVAIKLLPRQLAFDPMFRRRFQHEAKVIARLEHSAIVPLYDFGEVNEQPYLVMRYMAGGSLSERLKRPLYLPEISRLLNRIAPALDKSHRQHVVHRDLKPDNILFDEENQPYLSDFGIARLTEATQTMTIAGTPAYMSPEQVKGDQALDGRCDIYALGAILFEMLTGRPPYEADTPTKLMMKHVLEPVPLVLDVREDLPLVSQDIIDRAMAKEPDDRFQTAVSLATAVSQLANDEPIEPLSAIHVPVELPIVAKTVVESDKTAVAPRPIQITAPTLPQSTTVPSTSAQPRKSSPLVWVGTGLLLLSIALYFMWQGQQPAEQIALEPNAAQTAEAQAVVMGEPTPIEDVPADELSEAELSMFSDESDWEIELDETGFGDVGPGEEDVWVYTGETAFVTIIVEGEPTNNLILMVFPPDSEEPEYYSDFLPVGRGEQLLYTLEDGYQLLVEDTQHVGGPYTITVEPFEPTPIGLDEEITGEIIGANPEVFVFEDGPADVDVILELSPKDVGVISIYEPEDGSPDDWLYYSDQQDSLGMIVLENIELPAAAHYIWIRDVMNDGADFSLTLSEVAR